jgi:glycosyltransferase involved in cell wall biosynthesis
MRILLIARHYPPAVSGGAKRPFLLAQALRAAGADVRVAAPSLPEGEPGWAVPHPHRDPVTANVTPRYDRHELVRDLTLWPDPDIVWCETLVEAVLATGWKPDWVISTSPPESIHIAGQRLAYRTSAKWAADFRDLWLQSPHRRERLRPHRKIGETALAKVLLRKADLVTAVDPVVAAEVSRLGADNVHVLPHFVASVKPAAVKLPKDTLNVVHAGSIALSDPEADIRDMLHPFENARKSNLQLSLHLVGRLRDDEAEAARTSPAAEAISIRGHVPLSEALSFMAAADALIFVASAKMHVPPSKIVDYLMFDTPVIACGSGPWLKDPRVEAEDPEKKLAALKRGNKRVSGFHPPTAADSATRLLGLMRDAPERE